MISYIGYNTISIDEVSGKDGEFTYKRIALGDNGNRKKGCNRTFLSYPDDPLLPVSLEPGNVYRELTVGQTRPQVNESGEVKPAKTRISKDLSWKDKTNYILASSWDGYTYGGDGEILVAPGSKDSVNLAAYAIGTDGITSADGTYEVALFSFEGDFGSFAIRRSGDYGYSIYDVTGGTITEHLASKEAVAGWPSIASDEVRIATLQKKKEELEAKLKGIESELLQYSEKSEEVTEEVPE